MLLWRVGSRKPRAKLKGHTNNIRKVLFSPDGRTLASADDNGVIRLWDPAAGHSRATCKGHTNGLVSLAFSADGSLLASAGADGTIKLWNLAAVTPSTALAGHESMIFSVAISPDSSTLASASHDGTIKLWELATGRPETTIKTVNVLRCVVFSPDGAYSRLRPWRRHRPALGPGLRQAAGRSHGRFQRHAVGGILPR